MIRISIPSFSSDTSGKVVYKFERCFVLKALISVWCDADKDSSHIPGEEHVLLLMRFQVLKPMNMRISVSWLCPVLFGRWVRTYRWNLLPALFFYPED